MLGLLAFLAHSFPPATTVFLGYSMVFHPRFTNFTYSIPIVFAVPIFFQLPNFLTFNRLNLLTAQ